MQLKEDCVAAARKAGIAARTLERAAHGYRNQPGVCGPTVTKPGDKRGYWQLRET